ncbi:2-keto-4-pentenoate hydratase [Mycolicibacterium komossense]|uniref:Fumarylacetoacetate hydrolase family protein n=1 Tax=Mycolicibacterium komossense TaxID=1779 RepID=A0ABT3CJJ4_9MYCO|nr:fumarylacetoacetate hydrolase family protein [Mycolicibacterium komossense]
MLASQTRAELAASLVEAERSRVPLDPLTAGYPGIDVVDAYEIQLAASLVEAERSRVPLDPLTAGYPGIDVVDAYEIQLINIRARVAGGARVVGHKVGLSSEAMQKMMGVEEPDYGHLLADMEVFEDKPVLAGMFLYPRVEVEVGFILADDLPGAGCTEDDVLAATAAFAPSIELIDTRIKDWKIKLCDTIADNASSAGWVLGEERVSPKDIDIQNIDAVLTRNGEVVAEGRSDAVLGNPVTAVAWLARKVDSFGVRLKAGDVVLPGSCTRAIDARAGDDFVADFAGLGSVRLSFE